VHPQHDQPYRRREARARAELIEVIDQLIASRRRDAARMATA
jgi:hypothetical protein